MPRPDYDSQFCGTLPLHLINNIQGYGFLVITDHQLNIVQVSENISHFTGVAYQEAVDTPLNRYLQSAEMNTLADKLKLPANKKFSMPCGVFNKQGEPLLAIVSRREEIIIFEFEPLRTSLASMTDIYQEVRQATELISHTDSYEEILNIGARELKRISGFDKVMIYQFDEEWNGHVLAEAMEEGMESYIGMTFPASDIPKQARELYRQNPYRLIPDRDAELYKLYPIINPVTSAFTDLSSCNMRGVAKVHIEYLSNMNVKSSMSTRIMTDDRLWGLISCHHRDPYFLNFDECLVFELLSLVIASRITSLEIKAESSRNRAGQPMLTQIIEGVYAAENVRSGLKNSATLMRELLGCHGLLYCNNGSSFSDGTIPDKASVEELVNWLQAKKFRGIFSTHCLSDQLDTMTAIAENASGVLVFPILPENREYLILFRGESRHDIDWGGNPNHAIRFEKDGQTYHPRNSFRLWKESVKNQSIPFSKWELDRANDIHSVVLNSRLQEVNARRYQ